MSAHEVWWKDACFYHIYPLGFCGCPRRNSLDGEAVHRIERLHDWWDHLEQLGVTALLLGPMFESSSHGYDTVDFFQVDRRLGDWASLRAVCDEARRRQIRVVLDGVFHHVGRDFWAFRDLQDKRASSAYRDWFSGVNFDRQSPLGDPFAYDGWEGHYDLVKLESRNPDVRAHIKAAILRWVEELQIDGLRLDVAYQFDGDFTRALSGFCHGLDRPLWLMGEMIHGDYRQWVGEGRLDSGTNYEAYKGLWSSHVDVNYFEIAYSLNRLFGSDGIYRDLTLYNFCDNHDVARVASLLRNPAHLYPLHILLFTMPGIPSIYYGSEWGITGEKRKDSDWNLRPDGDAAREAGKLAHPHLADHITKLAAIRRECPALRYGDYTQLHLNHEQLAYVRRWRGDEVVVAANAAARPVGIELPVTQSGVYRDLLNAGCEYRPSMGRLRIERLDPTWGCVLQRFAA